MIAAVQLLQSQNVTGAGPTVAAPCGDRTYQVWGHTTSGAGSATVQIRGTNNNGLTWDVIGTITLTLGTADTSDGFTSKDRYTKLSANVTGLSGAGAEVSSVAGA